VGSTHPLTSPGGFANQIVSNNIHNGHLPSHTGTNGTTHKLTNGNRSPSYGMSNGIHGNGPAILNQVTTLNGSVIPHSKTNSNGGSGNRSPTGSTNNHPLTTTSSPGGFPNQLMSNGLHHNSSAPSVTNNLSNGGLIRNNGSIPRTTPSPASQYIVPSGAQLKPGTLATHV